MSELHVEGLTGEMRRTNQVVTKWMFFLTVPKFLLFALFPGYVIEATFGTEYVPGAVALSVLSIAFFSHALAGPNVNTLTSIGESRRIMYDNLVVAVVKVTLNLVLIMPLSYVGAATATAVSYLLLNELYAVQLDRLMGIHPFTASLVKPGGIAIGLALITYRVVTTTVTVTLPLLVGLSIGYVVVCSLVVLQFGGVEEEGVMLLLQLEDRFGVNLGPAQTLATRVIESDQL